MAALQELLDEQVRIKNELQRMESGKPSTVGWRAVRRRTTDADSSVRAAARVSSSYGPGPRPTTTMDTAI